MVHFLLDKGANINAVDKDMRTPLLRPTAIRFGHMAAARALCTRGANLEARDSSYRSALHAAAEKDDGRGIDLLVEAGASIRSVNRYGGTPLHSAADHLLYVQAMTALLKHSAGTNIVNIRRS